MKASKMVISLLAPREKEKKRVNELGGSSHLSVHLSSSQRDCLPSQASQCLPKPALLAHFQACQNASEGRCLCCLKAGRTDASKAVA